jgi:putative ABC transport system permease protein
MRERGSAAPPRTARLLLDLVARSEEKRTVAGDLDEWFAEIARLEGRRRARRWYWGQVIAALPEFLRLSFYWRTVMLKNDLKAASRDLGRQKMFSLIKIGGLAVGLACVWLILLYVRAELSFDRFHADAGRIYRVVLEDKNNTFQKSNKFMVSAAPLASALERECPEVEVATRLGSFADTLLRAESSASYETGIAADKNFFRVFSFPLVQGDADQALAAPNSLVLSESLARKIFHTANPMGRTVNLDGTTDAHVTGVCRDVPANTHLRFDYILSDDRPGDEEWRGYGNYTYVKLHPGVPADAFQKKMQAVVAAHVDEKRALAEIPFLLPLTDIHFATDFNFGMETTTDRRLVVLFSLIAVFILVLACINYMNLATARFVQRSKEVGIRRVVGAHRSHLARQFLVESLLVSGLAAFISLAFLAIALPAFNRWTGRAFSFRPLAEPGLLGILAAAALLTGLVAGSYPAVFLSSLRPGRILKSSGGPGFAAARVRNALVVFQFAVSIILIVSTGIVARQIHFIRTKDLGYDREQVLTVQVRDDGIKKNLEAIKTELLRSPDVLGVSVGNSPMDNSGGWTMTGLSESGEEIKNMCWASYVDNDFAKVFGVKLAQGRFFSPEYPSDSGGAVVLNEAAVQAFGWSEALGREVAVSANTKRVVVGVVKDYHFWSLHQKLEPAVLLLNPNPTQRAYNNWRPRLSVKIRPGRVAEVVAFVRKTYDSSKTLHPFQYEFLDDRFNRLYQNDREFGTIFAIFATLSVFIACIGMFGLAAFTAEQRAREISIRKVLGATASSIAALLSRHFLRWVVLANIIAWPVAYLLMRTWVKDFYYRVPISAGLFVLAGAAAAAFALMAVSVQTARAARTNPAERLRRE